LIAKKSCDCKAKHVFTFSCKYLPHHRQNTSPTLIQIFAFFEKENEKRKLKRAKSAEDREEVSKHG
jgi:hypothetical protein